jgi:hypothetical protein
MKTITYCTQLIIILLSFIGYIHPVHAWKLDTIVKEQSKYISSLRLSNGAITVWNPAYNGDKKINPYFANNAAMALLDANSVQYKTVVRNYINWYFSSLNWPDNQNMYGTIYDYSVINGLQQSDDSYDSADSYAATFLSLLRKYYAKTGDMSIFTGTTANRKYQISMITEVMSSLLNDSTSLTFAKKDYPIEYTMDNAEVYSWFQDAAYIFQNIYHDVKTANWYYIKASNVYNSIQKNLFDTGSQTYLSYYWSPVANLKIWYPDALVQIFPTLFWLPNDCKRYMVFKKNFPDWIDVSHWDDRFPMAFILKNAYKCGDYSSVKLFFTNTQNNYSLWWFPWPWNISEAAWTIEVASQCKKNINCSNVIESTGSILF